MKIFRVKVSCADEIALHSWSSCLHLPSVGLATPGCHFFFCPFGVVLRTCVRLLNSLGSSLPHGCFKGVVFYSAATCLFYTLVDFLTLVLKKYLSGYKAAIAVPKAHWWCQLALWSFTNSLSFCVSVLSLLLRK